MSRPSHATIDIERCDATTAWDDAAGPQRLRNALQVALEATPKRDAYSPARLSASEWRIVAASVGLLIEHKASSVVWRNVAAASTLGLSERSLRRGIAALDRIGVLSSDTSQRGRTSIGLGPGQPKASPYAAPPGKGYVLAEGWEHLSVRAAAILVQAAIHQDMTASSYRCLAAVLALTAGRGLLASPAAHSVVAEISGMDERDTRRALSALAGMGLIARKRTRGFAGAAKGLACPAHLVGAVSLDAPLIAGAVTYTDAELDRWMAEIGVSDKWTPTDESRIGASDRPTPPFGASDKWTPTEGNGNRTSGPPQMRNGARVKAFGAPSVGVHLSETEAKITPDQQIRLKENLARRQAAMRAEMDAERRQKEPATRGNRLLNLRGGGADSGSENGVLLRGSSCPDKWTPPLKNQLTLIPGGSAALRRNELSDSSPLSPTPPTAPVSLTGILNARQIAVTQSSRAAPMASPSERELLRIRERGILSVTEEPWSRAENPVREDGDGADAREGNPSSISEEILPRNDVSPQPSLFGAEFAAAGGTSAAAKRTPPSPPLTDPAAAKRYWRKREIPADLQERFGVIWADYPRKEAKRDALECFAYHVVVGGADPVMVHQAVLRYVEQCRALGRERRFTKGGRSFFSAGWLDYRTDADAEAADPPAGELVAHPSSLPLASETAERLALAAGTGIVRALRPLRANRLLPAAEVSFAGVAAAESFGDAERQAAIMAELRHIAASAIEATLVGLAPKVEPSSLERACEEVGELVRLSVWSIERAEAWARTLELRHPGACDIARPVLERALDDLIAHPVATAPPPRWLRDRLRTVTAAVEAAGPSRMPHLSPPVAPLRPSGRRGRTSVRRGVPTPQNGVQRLKGDTGGGTVRACTVSSPSIQGTTPGVSPPPPPSRHQPSPLRGCARRSDTASPTVPLRP